MTMGMEMDRRKEQPREGPSMGGMNDSGGKNGGKAGEHGPALDKASMPSGHREIGPAERAELAQRVEKTAEHRNADVFRKDK
jgi:hypothetical protein